VAVLVSEQLRISREDIFDAIQHWRLFSATGVSIITCQRVSTSVSGSASRLPGAPASSHPRTQRRARR